MKNKIRLNLVIFKMQAIIFSIFFVAACSESSFRSGVGKSFKGGGSSSNENPPIDASGNPNDVGYDDGSDRIEYKDLVLTGLRMEGPIESPDHSKSQIKITNKRGVSQKVQWPYYTENSHDALDGTVGIPTKVTIPGMCAKGLNGILMVEIIAPNGQTYKMSKTAGSWPDAKEGQWGVIGHKIENEVYMGYEMHGGNAWHEIDGAVVKFSCAESVTLTIDQLCDDIELNNAETLKNWYKNDLEGRAENGGAVQCQ